MRAVALLLLAWPCWGAFSFSRTVTVDHTKVSTSDQSNFPVLVSGTYSYLATVGNGGKVQNANGYDVGFYTNSDCSTGKMDWETTRYTSTTGAVIYWVRVATLSSSTDTVFYLCYADSGISTDQSNKTGVWDSNYKGVWHFPDGSTLGALDSTSNADNGTITGATATTGPTYTDGAANMANNAQYITIGGQTFARAQAATFSMWFKVANHSGNYSIVGGAGGALGLRTDTSSHVFATMVSVGDFTASTGTFADNTWTYFTFTQDGAGNFAYYLNGAAAGTGSTALNPNQPTTDVGRTSAFGESLAGSIDELRFSFSQRSAGWIATEYNTISDPPTFYAIGSETALGGGGGTRRTRGFIQ